MFVYPYIFWLVFVAYATPIIATVLGVCIVRRSAGPGGVWIAVPGFLMIHILAFVLAHLFHLDYDWLSYRADDSAMDWAVYHAVPVAEALGLGVVLWVGVRMRTRRAQRGFAVVDV